ncbi:Amino acid transporter [Haladaptatus litoreus]|uniref:Amino acid transporter n=1 Tax=Haladaptatus litoreus TaxID=553468 RepID=A0A1N6ZL91_9EURY|nr:amino acid permease [Haladaptatus litoreus]SIR27663.1 Amino acid transporter [Haladaptatus litoreus]
MAEHTRTLGFRVAFAIGLGTMIAAGIFSLSGTAIAQVGSNAVISFVIAAAIAGVTAASYSEFASIYAENGGGYLFSSRTFEDDRLLFAVGASLFLGYSATTAFYLATMGEWFHQFIIPHGISIPHGTVAVATAILLGVLNARGTEESGTFQVFVTGAKVAVLLAFIGGALAYQAPSATVDTFVGGFAKGGPTGIISIAAVAFITFFGFSAIAASAGEIINPKETVPKAIGASIITVTVLYIFVIVAMMNSPTDPQIIQQQGETAMGKVASDFLGSFGKWLIVAGAIFSMVSASNASILAASGIGSLMGKQGQAPRRFSRIHSEYGTPFWSVVACTGTIVALVVAFIALFPAEGGITPIHLGLGALTGFANLNLLAPLAVVNVALILSRRRFPEMERPLKVPLVPWLPIVGVLANLALITNLPPRGIVAGIAAEVTLVGAYLLWGGAPDTDEMMTRTVAARSPATNGGEPSAVDGGESVVEEAGAGNTERADEDRYRVLVPVARMYNAEEHVRLAGKIGAMREENPLVQVVNVTQIPEQTSSDDMAETAEARADRLLDTLAEADLDVDYTVEGHICRSVSFDILNTAREDEADLILMGYPKEHEDIAEAVEYDSPCDVLFVDGFGEESPTLDSVTVGTGGGPHHQSALSLANALGRSGSEVHVANVTPGGRGGTAEDLDGTLSELGDVPNVQTHDRQADTVAEGLVAAADEHDSVLVIGASRTRLLKRWVFGSTPDRVVSYAKLAGVPVIVCSHPTGVSGRLEDALFPVYRTLKKFRRGHVPNPSSN